MTATLATPTAEEDVAGIARRIEGMVCWCHQETREAKSLPPRQTLTFMLSDVVCSRSLRFFTPKTFFCGLFGGIGKFWLPDGLPLIVCDRSVVLQVVLLRAAAERDRSLDGPSALTAVLAVQLGLAFCARDACWNFRVPCCGSCWIGARPTLWPPFRIGILLSSAKRSTAPSRM